MNRGPEPRLLAQRQFDDTPRHNITIDLTSASRCSAAACHRER